MAGEGRANGVHVGEALHGRAALLAMGYGLFLAFYYACAQWGTAPLAGLVGYEFFHSVTRAAIACGYLMGIALGLRGHSKEGRLLTSFGIALVVVLAGIAVLSAGLVASPLFACLIAAALGLSVAGLNVCWVRAFARADARRAQGGLAVGTVVTGASWAAFELLVGDVKSGSFVLLAACAIASLAALAVLERIRCVAKAESSNASADVGGVSSLPDSLHFGFSCVSTSASDGVSRGLIGAVTATAPVMVRLAPVFACCAVVPLLQPLAGMMLVDQGMTPRLHDLVWAAGEVIAGCLLLLVWRIRGPKTDVVQLFSLMMPVVATVAVLFPFLGDGYWPIFFLLSEVLRASMLVAGIAACLRASQEGGVDAAVPYGLLALLMFVADFVGCALGPLVVSVTPASSDRARLIGVLLAFVFVAILMVTFFARRGLHSEGHKGGAWPTAWPADTPRTQGLGSPSDSVVAPVIAPVEVDECVRRVAMDFGLSPRETEVLALQARGRNVPFIAEALGVSPTTVRSHVKRIHQALGVHTQQELINLVEGRAN